MITTIFFRNIIVNRRKHSNRLGRRNLTIQSSCRRLTMTTRHGQFHGKITGCLISIFWCRCCTCPLAITKIPSIRTDRTRLCRLRIHLKSERLDKYIACAWRNGKICCRCQLNCNILAYGKFTGCCKCSKFNRIHTG